MNILLIDGHPDTDRLGTALLDRYAGGLPSRAKISRIAVRDLAFDPNLRVGYAGEMVWEPDLEALWTKIEQADHLTFAFPLWWGGEPAQLKGLLERLLLPGRAFSFRADSAFWDRLLTGRSADVIITMDTPPLYLRLAYGNAVVTRWKKQILGFVGMEPVRVFRFGPTRRGGATRSFEKWAGQLKRAAASTGDLRRKPKG